MCCCVKVGVDALFGTPKFDFRFSNFGLVRYSKKLSTLANPSLTVALY